MLEAAETESSAGQSHALPRRRDDLRYDSARCGTSPADMPCLAGAIACSGTPATHVEALRAGAPGRRRGA